MSVAFEEGALCKRLRSSGRYSPFTVLSDDDRAV